MIWFSLFLTTVYETITLNSRGSCAFTKNHIITVIQPQKDFTACDIDHRIWGQIACSSTFQPYENIRWTHTYIKQTLYNKVVFSLKYLLLLYVITVPFLLFPEIMLVCYLVTATLHFFFITLHNNDDELCIYLAFGQIT